MTGTISRLRSVVFALLATLAFAPLHAHADTYQLYGLGIDNTQFYGMTDSGEVVLYASFFSCGNPATGCYETFMNGVSTGNSDSAPVETWDNGTPCSPSLPTGGSVIHGVCNNGMDAFTGRLSPSQTMAAVYWGANPPDLLLNGGYGPIDMNSIGDIVFDEEVNDEWYEAVDITTPEPTSFLLLGTGILALAIPLRRRLAV